MTTLLAATWLAIEFLLWRACEKNHRVAFVLLSVMIAMILIVAVGVVRHN